MIEEVKYIVDLAKKHTNQLAFIPKPRIEEDFSRGQIFLECENDELCGFLHFTRGWPNLHITNACIQYDAQRRAHATNLVRRVIEKADREGYESISLWCASDLEANEFWRSVGFTLTGTRPGGKSRKRNLHLWVMRMPSPIQTSLFTVGQCRQ